ncbi:hypothetical protein [Candidatus Cetobacterium colombiensis]|uniref:YokE-like PH domain-containing protein n=1 Tax=Candidatus Cetobacterium colombiensis TaxID=3073100 RepID=A0ABU4WAK6_9FUSO|nr:hypothetical protein [Candidatus Cetobacterium colombiensis]MDX8336569.1 hypothetical protein [Candidatus Cetobacterium colombiensis]
MFSGVKLFLIFFLIPLSKMKKVNPKVFLENFENRDIIYPNEVLYTAYDNRINSLLITSTRIISVFKLRNRINIFSIPLFQLGTVSTYSLRFLKINGMCVTSSPGFKFYWFFNHDVCMETLSNEISKVVADVQIDGGSKLAKIFK